MNKKISLGLALALIFVSITATFAVTMTVSQRIYNNLISRLSGSFELYDGIYAIDNYVKTNFYTEVDDTAMLADTAEGYMKGLKDSGSYYMNPEAYIEYTRKIAGEGGIGIAAEYDEEKAGVFVTAVYEGSSAEKAEIKVGDRIIALDEESVSYSNYEKIIEDLQYGRKFESISLTYSRNGVTKKVTVVRGNAQSVISSSLGEVGYVKFIGFFDNTAQQFGSAVDTLLNEQGITSLIIDLRGCGEGTIANAAKVADILLPSGAESSNAIAQSIKRDGSVLHTYTSDTSSKSFTEGIVVLTDAGTSGGAELIIAQLRDFSKCTVIGTKTAGQMTEQTVFPLENGSAISLTVAYVSSFSGKTYRDGKGIEPDTILDIPEDNVIGDSLKDIKEDGVIQSAYVMLTAK